MMKINHFIVSILTIVYVSGCSSNLDSQCADFYTNINEALDRIIVEGDEEKRAALTNQLKNFEERFISLKTEANKRYKEKLASGELPINLSELPFDDLSQRKTQALNGFADRRWEIENPPKILKEIMGFTLTCNQYLR